MKVGDCASSHPPDALLISRSIEFGRSLVDGLFQYPRFLLLNDRKLRPFLESFDYIPIVVRPFGGMTTYLPTMPCHLLICGRRIQLAPILSKNASSCLASG